MQFSTQFSLSGGIISLKNKQEYSLIKVFNICFAGSEHPIFIELAMQGGTKPQN